MAAEVSYNNAWYTFGGTLAWKNVTSKSYTPFGEQIGENTSGFGYNGEYYNAATGQIYLRARFYEPEMNRFSQKDVVRGSIAVPNSLNRYLYCQNDPVNFVDGNGQSLATIVSQIGNKIKTAAKNAVNNVIKKATTTVSSFGPVKSSIASKVSSIKSAITKSAIRKQQGVSIAAQKARAATLAAKASTAGTAQLGATQLSTTQKPSVASVTSSSCSSGANYGRWNPWDELPSWRAMHDQVTTYLAVKFHIRREVPISRITNIPEGATDYVLDLYSSATNMYWEVKPVSYIKDGTWRHNDLIDQMSNYNKYATPGLPLGYHKFWSGPYRVYIYSFSNGTVYYKFRRERREERATETATESVAGTVPNPEDQRMTSSSNVFLGVGLMVSGGALIAGTLFEDFASEGIGVIDDPATISEGIEMILDGLVLIWPEITG